MTTRPVTSAQTSWVETAVRYVPFVLAAMADHLAVVAMLVIVGWRVAALTMSSRDARSFSTLATVAALLFVYLENSALGLV